MPDFTLPDHHRRILANLTIPRNVDDLTYHVRPFVNRDSSQIDTILKNDLTENGWVVKVDDHRGDSVKIAAKVQDLKKALDLPDEKAEIYTRRMKRPDLAWRARGELWMLTNEGLEALREKPADAPSPMTPSQVQAAIDQEWNRVLRDPFKEGETQLANKLLEDEFHAWAKDVADDCERRWGKESRPQMPMAGGASGWSDAYEVALIDAENQKTALGAVVDPWFMALSIVAFTDADTGTTADDGTHKPTYTGYARKSVAGTDMAAATSGSGSSSNVNAITFAACTAGTSTIVAFANTSALTLGTLRKWGDCASTVISTTQTPATFAVGAYTTSAN